ncbi:MAG TPA: VCBS repeat-containing protein [Terracidiphilus sp.]|jgi:hypothetical protein
MRCPVVATGAAMLGLFASHPAPSQTLSKQFIVPQQLSGVSNSYFIASGDLNGDGRPDILYDDRALIATGNGTFKTVTESQTFVYGSQLIDVNGDGKLDVVSAIPAEENCNQFPNGEWDCVISSDAELVVYLGNGNGTFQTGKVLDLGQEGAGTSAITMADMDGDGKPDAVISFSGVDGDSSSSTNFQLINQGDGIFKNLGSFWGNGPVTVVGTGDFNGDGKIDLAISSGGLQILYNLGGGRFTSGPTYNIFPIAGLAGDFNKDGHIDLVVADASGLSTNGVYVLYGQNGGTFTAPKRLTSLTMTSLNAADLNHDGYLDVIAMGSSFAVFTNQKSSFSSPRVYTGLGYNPAYPTFGLGDFNRDGYVDVAYGSFIMYGTSGANFQAPVVTASTGAGRLVAGDFNGDGIEDVATVDPEHGAVTVFLGSGQGYLNPGKTYVTPLVDANITAGDVNGDGIPDLVVTRGPGIAFPQANDVSVLLGNGDGTFQIAINSHALGQPPSNTLSRQTYAVDVNHDGKADLIGDWGVALGHGDGTFETPSALPSNAIPVAGIAVGDFNRDGNLDIVVGSRVAANTTPVILTLLGDSHGNFTLTNTEHLNYTGPTLNALTVGDINGDGILDIVYDYSATPSIGPYDRIVVEFGDGTGKFGNATGVRLAFNGAGNDQLFVADFNRDGKMDVLDVTVTANGGPVQGDSILINGAGGGQLGAPQYFPLQMLYGALLDLDSNGAPDIIGPDIDGSGVARILNSGAKP